MQPTLDLKKLYEEDENLWLFENAKLIREGKIDQVDFEHIAECLEDMGIILNKRKKVHEFKKLGL